MLEEFDGFDPSGQEVCRDFAVLRIASMLPLKHDNVSVHNQYTCQRVNVHDQADRYKSCLAHSLNGSFHLFASLIDDGKEALICFCSTLSTVEGPMRFNERHSPGSNDE